jgi:hypothetical protein
VIAPFPSASRVDRVRWGREALAVTDHIGQSTARSATLVAMAAPSQCRHRRRELERLDRRRRLSSAYREYSTDYVGAEAATWLGYLGIRRGTLIASWKWRYRHGTPGPQMELATHQQPRHAASMRD